METNFVAKMKKNLRIELGSILNTSGINGAADPMSKEPGYTKYYEEALRLSPSPSLPAHLFPLFSLSPYPTPLSLCNPHPMHGCTWFFCVWYGTLAKPTYQDSLEESSEVIICTILGEKWEFWSDIDGDQRIKVDDSYWTDLAALCTKIGFHKAVHPWV